MSTLAKKEAFNIEPKNFGELMKYAEMIANSDLAPKDYKGKPGNVLVAIQMGAELGLKPMQALQNIAVINGRGTIWGDAALALVQSHPEYDGIKEEGDEKKATCTIKRKGEEPHTVTFTEEDAKIAGLWGKAGPWTQYKKRMLQVRARGFALRDKFPDALKGLILVEEARDYQSEEKLKFVNQTKGAEGLKAVLGVKDENKEPARAEPIKRTAQLLAAQQALAEAVPGIKAEAMDLETGEVIDTWAIQNAMNKAQDLEELEAIAADLKELSIDAEQRKFLGGIYKIRKGELSGSE